MGSKTVRTIPLALIVIIVLSATIGGYLVWNEVRTGGMQVEWTYKDKDAFGHFSNSYTLIRVGEDGTIYASENLGAWRMNESSRNFIALNPDGSLKWKAGCNGFSGLSEGADGRFYYVGWKNVTDWSNDQYKVYQNLTAIDGNGNYLWSFHVSNGSLDLWATYPDGTVITNHYNYAGYNSTSQKYEDTINEIIAIGPDGQVLWRRGVIMDLGTGFTHPSVSPNGTFLVYTFNTNDDSYYELGYDKSTGESYAAKMDHKPGQPANGPNDLNYRVLKEHPNNTSSVTTMIATYPSNGTIAWKTVLLQTDEPNNKAGVTAIWPAIVDGTGALYFNDNEAGYIFAVTSEGTIIWQKPYAAPLAVGYPSEGLILRNESSIIKVNGDGSLAWRYGIDNDLVSDWNTVVGPDGSMYFSGDNSIVALSRSPFSTNLQLLTVLLAFDVIVIAVYLRKRTRVR